MSETLLNGTSVHLIGRVMDDITLSTAKYTANDGHGNSLQKQLAGTKGKQSYLARIYAYSFGNVMTELDEPTIFLVHGPGRVVNDPVPPPLEAIRSPSTDKTGVGAQDYVFTDDMRYWEYDKNDISLRLDLYTGTLEDILLMPGDGGEQDFYPDGGGKVGGGRVGGGRVGGGRVGGGRVGGGRVGGGRVGGS
jgi:hypothetical protein